MIYQIITSKGQSGNDGFDSAGRPHSLPRITVLGRADAIHAVQQEFVSSGNTVDEGQKTTIQPEDINAIAKTIADYQPQIDAYLRRFGREYCSQYQRLARRYNWTARELREFYDRSLEATKRVLRTHPE